MDQLLWFVFHLVAQYYEMHRSEEYGYGHAMSLACADLNKVIVRHNQAYWERLDGKLGWHDTSDYTDNQCVFSSLLESDVEYKLIDIMPCKNCGLPSHRNRGYCKRCRNMGLDL